MQNAKGQKTIWGALTTILFTPANIFVALLQRMCNMIVIVDLFTPRHLNLVQTNKNITSNYNNDLLFVVFT